MLIVPLPLPLADYLQVGTVLRQYTPGYGLTAVEIAEELGWDGSRKEQRKRVKQAVRIMRAKHERVATTVAGNEPAVYLLLGRTEAANA